MRKEVSISIYLDTRRVKSSGNYPVKLRVFAFRKQKLYSTVFELSEKEFKSAWETVKPRSEFKDLRNQLLSIEQKAINAAKDIVPFSFEQFEKALYRKSGAGSSVLYHLNELIEDLNSKGQLNTKEIYNLCRVSLAEYSEVVLKKPIEKVSLLDVTPGYLSGYEKFMTEKKGRTLTTVSIYLRALRAVFNKAIEEKEIDKDHYPFGKRRYQVPAVQKVKKTLSKSQLKVLFDSVPLTPEQERAKAFFFFSYASNGMNMKDISLLRFKDIDNDRFAFYRAKTKNTSKSQLKPITVYLNDFISGVIEKYGNADKSPENYVFPILEHSLDLEEQRKRIKNFTRYVNQHLTNLCKSNKLPEISTYWARHSFATNAIRSGASMEFIQESLGHGNLSTTQNYFAGFDDEAKKEFASEIMNFG